MSLAIQRIGLAACVALSVLALAADVASAAGKPTSVEIINTHELGGYTVLELTAKVNPNGASTSTTIELREDGAKEKEEKEKKAIPWTEGVTHNLSGTTVRSYSEEFRVSPVKDYEVRVTAKNLYGSTVSATGHGALTHVRTTGEKELTNVPFGSTGVATFAFTYLSLPIAVVCGESTSGHIGNAGGADTYKYSISNCVTYIQGEKSTICKVGPFTFTLSGPTLAVQNPYFIPLPVSGSGCSFEQYWQIYPEPFRVVDDGSTAEYGKTRSVSLTASGYLFASNPAVVTIESNWFLTAEYAGTPFKITSTGP